MPDIERLNWAYEEALKQWEGKEGEHSHWFAHTAGTGPDDLAYFNEFLSRWRVARTLRRDAKPRVLHLLLESYRSAWIEASQATEGAYESVEQFAAILRERGFTPRARTPTSFASKAAFMCNPAVFAPYDRFGRSALRDRGFQVRPGDYRAYMRAFSQTTAELSSTTASLVHAFAAKSTRAVDRTTAQMRIVDKLLMREGGFRI